MFILFHLLYNSIINVREKPQTMSSLSKQTTPRIFSIADRRCPSQPTGGPGGVNLRLYLANEKYHLIESIYHVFEGKVLNHEKCWEFALLNEEKDRYEELSNYYRLLDNQFEFIASDIFIFHDAVSAFIFLQNFKTDKTVLVYHQQGSLYREWEYFTGLQNAERKEEQDSLLISVLQQVAYVAFPSFGAKDSLIASEPSMEPYVTCSGLAILYNGFDNPGYLEAVTPSVQKAIAHIHDFTGITFITVATLNAAKGVEQIPQFLAALRRKGINFQWIIIGDGITANLLQEQIDIYEINDTIIWFREHLPHNDILSLLQYTDFYLLTHRFSIFDFATIEAMSYENVPILTPVGGNFEFIQDDNGVLLYHLDSCEELTYFIKDKSLSDLKKKNALIANTRFSEKAFLEGYLELIQEF